MSRRPVSQALWHCSEATARASCAAETPWHGCWRMEAKPRVGVAPVDETSLFLSLFGGPVTPDELGLVAVPQRRFCRLPRPSSADYYSEISDFNVRVASWAPLHCLARQVTCGEVNTPPGQEEPLLWRAEKQVVGEITRTKRLAGPRARTRGANLANLHVFSLVVAFGRWLLWPPKGTRQHDEPCNKIDHKHRKQIETGPSHAQAEAREIKFIG